MGELNMDNLFKEFEEKTPNSKKIFEEAKEVIPGGVSANIKYFEPYPIEMEKGNGAYLTDADGNEYIDYILSYGALMLGHGNPRITKAINDHMKEHGSALYGTPHVLEAKMAKKIREIYPSIEMLRYTNSGTEATLFAIRMACAYTGKYKIAKFEGHYHGGHNRVLLSVNPPIDQVGDEVGPNAIAESRGLEPYQFENTIILPFNNLEACEKILRDNKDELAGVIMEVILGGYIPAEKEFLVGLRKITEELGIVLIFDEVKTGFRIGIGGAQSYYGVKPDLTTLGKVIGGGFPVGILGGKKEIMMTTAPHEKSDIFDASNSKKSSASDVLFHSGTYNGHPLILSVGLAVLEELEEKMDIVLKNTEVLKNGIKALYEKKNIKVKTIGVGTVFNILITDRATVKNYREMQDSNFELRKKIDYALLLQGIYNKPLNRYSLSTVHTEKEINKTLEIYEKVLTRL